MKLFQVRRIVFLLKVSWLTVEEQRHGRIPRDGHAPAPSDLTNQGEVPMIKNLMKLLKDEEGATALEYGLIAAAIAGVIITVVYMLGGNIDKKINNLAQHI
jgi:pilus assembly protein Flp/PilA